MLRQCATVALRARSRLIQEAVRSRGHQCAFVRSNGDYRAPLREMSFVINEVNDFPAHYQTLKHQNGDMVDKEMVQAVIEEMGKFCETELAPLNAVGDEEGCTWIDEKTVKTPTGFKDAYDKFVEGGWQGLSYPEHLGGQGLPQSLALFATEMAAAANWTWVMYPGLSKGAINTLLSHGTKELVDKYAHRMISGEWTGTMCLTEPQCGSDLGQVKTKAVPQEDGSYKITGTKIFISCGDHDMTDNILHCVLARLPGAPEGTRGISLFLVPKYKVGDDGAIGEYNQTNIGRIESKMGCHGSSTCEINFDEAEGFLLGTENKGLNHMFTFINTSRMGTAVQGQAGAENSFQNSLWYAKDRGSMRSLTGTKEPDMVADPIIVHPGVRSMLLTQKAIAEGGRAMVYECAKLADQMYDAEQGDDKEEWKRVDGQMAFLTPILKGFLSEMGVEAANLGIQVYGGHGYIKSNKQEQYLRDVRISAVWEGTTQIQALDLLGRKIMLQKLAPINQHCAALRTYCMDIVKSEGGATRTHALSLLRHAVEWQALTYGVGIKAKSNKDAIGVASVDYLMYSGYVQLAYHWLRMEVAANKALAGKPEDADQEPAFYKAKQQTSNFVFDNLLPRTRSLRATMFTPIESVMDMEAKDFSFDHALA
jgi:alkylation response protein AidB-like acyl-CoA dehydrogenase